MLAPGRQAYLVNVEGSLNANGTQLATRDAMTMEADTNGAMHISLDSGSDGSHFMLIEMALSSS